MTDILFADEERNELSYDSYEECASDCDVLLWEPTSWYGKVIARSTGGAFSHASVALRWDRVLMSVGFEEGRGAVVEPLRNVVARHPGKISVFKIHRNGAPELLELEKLRGVLKINMLRDLSGVYMWSNIRLIALLNLPITRVLFPSFVRRRLEAASHRTAGGICSQWVARAFDRSSFRVLNKPTAITSPNDLATSTRLRYFATLTSEQNNETNK